MARGFARAKGFGKALSDLDDLENRLLKIKSNLSGQRTILEIPSINFGINIKGIDRAQEILKVFPEKVKKAHDQAMIIVCRELKQALDRAMEADVWQWHDGTRDIIDTGALKASGRVTYNSQQESVSITYDEEYAAIVHFGGYTKSGYNPNVQIYYPARPWIQATLQGTHGISQFPFAEIYGQELAKRLK